MKYIVLLILTWQVHAEVGVEAIIERANLAAFYAGDDGRAEARMVIVDGQGNKQMRQFKIWRHDQSDGGDQNFLVAFSRPADVKDTVFLVHKKAEGNDDRWLYLPALDLEKRIAASDNRSSFVGSDFYYEDVSGRHPNADVHELTAEDEGHYLIKSTPKDATAVEFAHYTMAIDKDTFLPMKVGYFDQQGQLMRQVEVLKTAMIQGHPTVMQSKVSNLQTGSHTLMAFRKPEYNIGLTAEDFSTRALRKPPK